MPTLTISTTPQTYSPIYPQIYFGTTCASYSTADFKYIFQLNVLDPNTFNITSSSTYPIPPRPNGQGLFSPSSILKSQTSYKVYPNIGGLSPLYSSVIPYNISYGFQYNPALSFFNIGSQSTSNAWLMTHTYVDLQAGDKLKLVMDNQTVNYGYNGECDILQFAASLGVFYYKINKNFVGAVLPQSGTITSQRRLNGTSSVYYAYDGTRQYKEINTNFGNERVFDNFNSYQYALTNYHDHILPPDISMLNTTGANCKKIYSFQDETLSIMVGPSFSGVQRYRFYDSGLNLLSTTTQSIATASIRYEVPTGTKNLLSGSIVGSVSNTKFYSYEILGNSLMGYTYSNTGTTYSITGGLYFAGVFDIQINDGGTTLPNGTAFTFLIDDGSVFCISNYQTGIITGTAGPGLYHTSIIPGCFLDVGAELNGVFSVATRTPFYSNISKFIKFYEIVDNCSPYDNFRILFQNLHGGTDYWNFNWKHTNVLTINKNEWRKQLAYNYTVGDRQDSILSTKANETFEVSTDWVSEYDMNFLKELLTSKEVYLRDDDTNTNLPLIITTTNWQVKTTIDNKLFACSITFRMAYDITLQN